MNEPMLPQNSEESPPEFADIVDRLTDQLLAGESVSIADYIQQYPEMATELHAAWQSLRQICHVKDNLGCVDDLTTFPRRQLGDFRLLREIGRGGMGVVFEAEQISLGRRVAVKVLPFSAFLNSRQLQRFKLEAQAAAALHHHSIVAVHCVGCDHGVHFYAMDLVNGCSLAQLIESLRNTARIAPGWGLNRSHTDGPILPSDGPEPANCSDPCSADAATRDTRPMAALSTEFTNARHAYYRSVARMLADITDAIHYAHDQGVIHRDLKPSNILLDAAGRPWITDFGLALTENNHSLTMTGDVVGTLRYMSPEQAGGRKLLDHRTDIYSLGVTLYELLTLRPALSGTTRQELLRQLDFESPLQPSRLAPSLPRDLETIVLKCIAKHAEDRYPSARDLADDLRRFLEKRTIKARRTSRVHQMWRLATRHPWSTALCAAVFVMALSLGIGGAVVASHYARLASQLSAAQRQSKNAQQQAELTRDNLLKILSNTLATNVETMEDIPDVGGIHERLVRDTLDQYRELLQEPNLDLDARYQIASGLRKLAGALDIRFDRTEAQKTLSLTLSLTKKLVQQQPLNPQFRYLQAQTEFYLGSMNWNAENFAAAVRIMRPLVVEYPDNDLFRCELAWGLQYVGQVRSTETRWHESLEYYDHAVEHWHILFERAPDNSEFRRGLAHNHLIRGKVLGEQGRFAEGQSAMESGLRLADADPEHYRQSIRARIGYADGLCSLGRMLCCRQRPVEALDLLTQAATQLEAVVKDYPKSEWANRALADAHRQLAEAWALQGDFEAAIRSAKRARQVAASPSYMNPRLDCEVCLQLAQLLVLSDQSDEASIMLQECIQTTQNSHSPEFLTRIYCNAPIPSCRDATQGLRYAQAGLHEHDHHSLRLLSLALYRAGQHDLALERLNQCVALTPTHEAVDRIYRALIYLALHDATAAREAWQEACSLSGQPSLVSSIDLQLAQKEAEQALAAADHAAANF